MGFIKCLKYLKNSRKGARELLYHLTDSKYLSINTGAIDEIDIGEWDDDHPLNSYETDTEAYFQERLQG